MIAPLTAASATWNESIDEGRKRGGRKKRAAVQPTEGQIKGVITELMAAAYAPSTHRAIRAAMGAWDDFATSVAQTRPVLLTNPRWAGDMQASLHNEMSLMMFAAWMVANGLAASTTGTYISLVKTKLGVQFGWALTCKEMEMRLPRLLKGIKRQHKRIRKKRLGWRARLEKELEAVVGAPVGEQAWTQAALRRGLRQGLLRGADCLPDMADAFDKNRHATIGDVTECAYPEPHLRWKVQPAKKSEQNGKTEMVYLPKGNGVTDGYTAIKKMLEYRQGAHDDEPLFLAPNGKTWTTASARALFKESAKALGQNPDLFGAHSGRIGGATDLFAEDCDGVMMQIQGRWYAARSEPAPPHNPHTRAHQNEDYTDRSNATDRHDGLCATTEIGRCASDRNDRTHRSPTQGLGHMGHLHENVPRSSAYEIEASGT